MRMHGAAAIAAAVDGASVVAAGVAVDLAADDGVVVVVIVVQPRMVKRMTGSRGCSRQWQWGFDGTSRAQLLMLMVLVMLLLLLMMVLLLLLLLLGGGRHRQQPLPVVTNDLPLVLRILVRRSSHIAVAQSRWRWRMWCTLTAITLILEFVKVEILVVAGRVRAKMCVSYVSGDLRTRCVDSSTALPGAFVDWLACPSLSFHVLAVVHSDAFVRE